MSWIKMAVAGIALCAGAQVASAQGAPAGAPQGPPQGAQGQRGRGMQMLFEGITLTDAQQKQVQEISEKYRAQMRELMPGGFQGGPPDDKTRDKMEDLREKQMKEIKAVLTHDQQEIFEKNVDAQKKRMEERRKQQGNGQ